MKAIAVLFYGGILSLGAEDSLKSSLPKQIKEDQYWITNQMKQLLKEGFSIEKDELLPEKEKGQQFFIAADDVLKDVALQTEEAKELNQWVALSCRKENLEGAEPFFQPSQSIITDPEQSVGILSSQTQIIPEEAVILRCQESGVYQLGFVQKRTVKPVAPIKKRVKQCKQHVGAVESFFSKGSAKDRQKELEKILSKDSSIEVFRVQIEKAPNGLLTKYNVVPLWKHKDNSTDCSFVWTEEVITPSSVEEDSWETDSAENLAIVESNPNCRLLYSQLIEGPGIHLIEGQSIFRDSWSRQLFFSCEPDANSPCAHLRAQGGVLIKKACIKGNRFGECDLYEKTYDLGKKASYSEKSPIFSQEEIWGLSDAFDATYDKNQELSTVLSTLSIFSDIKRELEGAGTSFDPEKTGIFRGKPMRCQCSFIKGALYDCCKKMEGMAVSVHLARCTSEERSLAELRHAGRCHHIGSQKEHLGMQTTQSFCCFPTKMARILHEQGREQLGISWGATEEPSCRGFSLSELQKIDFTQIDLSDVVEDFAIDKEELLNRIRSTIVHLQDAGKIEGESNTKKIAQHEEVLHAP